MCVCVIVRTGTNLVHAAAAVPTRHLHLCHSAALERWSTESGGKRELRFQCASEQVTESRGHLLECIHSMGQQLPAGGLEAWACAVFRSELPACMRTLPTAGCCPLLQTWAQL